MFGKVRTEIRVAEVAEHQFVAPKVEYVVFVLAPLELSNFALRVTAVVAGSGGTVGH